MRLDQRDPLALLVPSRKYWPVAYRERLSAVPGAVLWHREVQHLPATTRILPDGCLDLLWDGHSLVVAGPDSTARWHQSPAGASYAALRFSGGTGPALLGVPAHELRDRTLDLADLWPTAAARVLAERVASSPAAVLEAWALGRAGACEVDPLGPRVFALAGAGLSVAQIAAQLRLGSRQLHRRCLPLFGYGPRRLTRVLRLNRALGEARKGVSLGHIAYACGYADQAHLSREVRDLAGTTPTRLLRELGRG